MSIKVECDSCFSEFSIKDDAAGRTIKCRECGESIKVPVRRAPVVARRKKPKEPKPKRYRKKDPLTGGDIQRVAYRYCTGNSVCTTILFNL